MTIQVVNRRTYRGPGQYVGRPSPLGNPFVIGRHGTREQVVESYRQWLWQQCHSDTPVKKELLRLVRIYKRQGKLTLICWCAPEACHADVIARAITHLSEGGNVI